MSEQTSRGLSLIDIHSETLLQKINEIGRKIVKISEPAVYELLKIRSIVGGVKVNPVITPLDSFRIVARAYRTLILKVLLFSVCQVEFRLRTILGEALFLRIFRNKE